ncbi:hypothetical protein, partial [Duncaniella muris]
MFGFGHHYSFFFLQLPQKISANPGQRIRAQAESTVHMLNWAQAESTVHMLNWAIRSVKFLGVEF